MCQNCIYESDFAKIASLLLQLFTKQFFEMYSKHLFMHISYSFCYSAFSPQISVLILACACWCYIIIARLCKPHVLHAASHLTLRPLNILKAS